MICHKCKKEVQDNSTFCKSCRSELSGVKTCPNGHKYSANLDKCPHCPSSKQETMLASGRTEFDSSDDNESDKTFIDNSVQVLKVKAGVKKGTDSDSTIIISPSVRDESHPSKDSLRKLIGWLVTWDIDPTGIDYKLYIGKTKIGRDVANDVIINQPGISDKHAIILYRSNKLWIQDNLSTNGTYVNDVEIEDKTQLKNHDIIKIGNVSIKLVLAI